MGKKTAGVEPRKHSFMTSLKKRYLEKVVK
jgi:hypothetical protein